MFSRLVTILFLFIVLSFVPTSLVAGPIPIGILSVDAALSPLPPAPGSTHVFATFDILNGTGMNDSAFPDMSFPVATQITFTNFVLTLFLVGGGTNVYLPSQFTPDGSGGFSMNAPVDLTANPMDHAILTGITSPVDDILNDGVTATKISQLGSFLVPAGNSLQPGDFAVVNAVPEPRSWMLLGSGLAVLCLLRGRRSRPFGKVGAVVSAVLFVQSASWAAAAPVKLNVATQPASVIAGSTTAYLTGSGFPAVSFPDNKIDPSQVAITIGATCMGSPVAAITAASVMQVVGTSQRISFLVPSLPTGIYNVSVSGKMPQGTLFASTNCSTMSVQNTSNFLKVSSGSFWLGGSPFRFGGTNIYSLMYSKPAAVDALYATALASEQKIVRTWAWIDIGGNGTPSIRGAQNGFYFQYWPVNGTAPAYNDGATGLQNLDYEVFRAGQLGIKLIMAFTNNWNDFGGMDQYVAWLGLHHHDDFYTDPTIRQWYKNYIAHLLNRVNTLTGIPYKNDPTIVMWELANEPRCGGSDNTNYPASSACRTTTLVNWVQDVSSYIKTIDPNHLVAVGDEGFYCSNPGSSDFTINCSQGDDNFAFAQAPAIDAMSFHLYPDSWGKNLTFSQNWISQHITDAASLGKPAYMGEYGWTTQNTRLSVYQNWTNEVLSLGGAGALFWDLLPGSVGLAFSDPNGFDLTAGAPEFILFDNFSKMVAAGQVQTFPPVAGNQAATTPFGQPVSLSPLQNDIAYGTATIVPSTIDLDPNTAGQQTSVTTGVGTFALQANGTVLFTPASGYSGPALATYTVQDSAGATSNVAALSVTVQANPNATVLTLFSFETGTDGWGAVNAAANGAVQQISAFHTNGSSGLQVTVATGDWFGASLSAVTDLSKYKTLLLDVQTLATGTSVDLQFTSGNNFDWCQGTFGFVNANTTATVTLDLTNVSALTCFSGAPDLTRVRQVHIFLSPGTVYLDYLRAQQ
jgi:mannan endo-1,4-beta-mannosidase